MRTALSSDASFVLASARMPVTESFVCALTTFCTLDLNWSEHLVVAFRHGTGYDERRTGVVDEHGVDLIDDSVVVLALYEVVGVHRHVVAEIVEAELLFVPKVMSHAYARRRSGVLG